MALIIRGLFICESAVQESLLNLRIRAGSVFPSLIGEIVLELGIQLGYKCFFLAIQCSLVIRGSLAKRNLYTNEDNL